MEKYLDILAASRLFAGIEREKLPALIAALSAGQKAFRRGEYILRPGDAVTFLGVIVSGRVLVIKEDFWGGRHILTALGPGQCFAETFACVPGSVLTVGVTAESDTEVLFLNAAAIRSAEGEGSARLCQNLLRDMAAKNLAFTEKLTHLGQRTTRDKLLSFLSAQADRQGSVEFDIPFSRQQLADYLLVERSGLSAELGKMQREGLLEFRKNHFRLLDKKDA